MKAVIFGAGNIGRGFLGALLHKAGFRVTFIDVDTNRVATINREGFYPVFITEDSGIREELVTNIDAVRFDDEERASGSILEADIVLTAVGKNALPSVATCLAKGLQKRAAQRPHPELHVVIVACENIEGNTTYLQEHVFKHLTPSQSKVIRGCVSFPDCIVDRIVPNAPKELCALHPLAVTVEEYFQLAVDVTALKGPMLPVSGIELSSNLEALLMQKLFTLNMAHALVGYFGHLRDYEFVHEAVADKKIVSLIQGAFVEVSVALRANYPSITEDFQRTFADKTLRRFGNSQLRDRIDRLTRSPKRKLGGGDRLVKPARLALRTGCVPSFLGAGIAAALGYQDSNDSESTELQTIIHSRGVEVALQEVTGLSHRTHLARLITAQYHYRSL